MKSFLLKDKKPILKWGSLPENVFFEGEIPEGYSLAVSPSENYIVVDVDKHGDTSGFENIPHLIQMELDKTFNYQTKNNGKHYWLMYSGNKPLGNKTSGLGIDLRTKKGYCVFYLPGDIRDYIHLIKETSNNLNIWLEKLFSYKHDKL